LRTVQPGECCATTHPPGTFPTPLRSLPGKSKGETPMKGIIAWLLGVPIVVIILLYVFNIF
jgi:hypothetical protein